MVTRSTPHQSRTRPSSLRPLVVVGVIGIVVILVILLALSHWLRSAQNGGSNNQPTTTSNHSSKNLEPAKGSSSSNGDQSNQAPDNTSVNQAPSGTLLAPTGNFVSSHSVSSDSALTSTCNTTPGATCQILFTNNGAAKALPVETVNGGGATFWGPWHPKDYGLTSGSWTVTAVAKLGSQTLTAVDAHALEIQ